MKTKRNKEQIVNAAKKMLQDKQLVNEFLKGSKSKKDLNDNGIKLAMPL